MKQHLQLMDDILTKGRKKLDRTGVGTYSIFGAQMEFDLREGYPLVTTRKIFTRGIFEELFWFLGGGTNNEDLVGKNVHIWDKWALEKDYVVQLRMDNFVRATMASQLLDWQIGAVMQKLNSMPEEQGHVWLDSVGVPRHQDVVRTRKGALGPIYGEQWRRWINPNGTTTDQIADLLNNLATRPYSRRHIITGWNPSVLPDESASHAENVINNKAVLPPCHTIFQFIVEPLTQDERVELLEKRLGREKIAGLMMTRFALGTDPSNIDKFCDEMGIEKDMLSLKLYARKQVRH